MDKVSPEKMSLPNLRTQQYMLDFRWKTLKGASRQPKTSLSHRFKCSPNSRPQVAKRDKSDSVLYHMCISHHTCTVHTYHARIRIQPYVYDMAIHTICIYGDITAAEAQSSAQRYYTGASKGASHLLLLYYRAQVFEMGAWLLPQQLTLQISSTIAITQRSIYSYRAVTQLLQWSIQILYYSSQEFQNN